VQFAGTNLNQETAGFIQGFEAYKDENIAKSNANPEAYRDAYAMRLTADYTRPLGGAQLSIRPFVRHSRMDFLQHFLIGKPPRRERPGLARRGDVVADGAVRGHAAARRRRPRVCRRLPQRDASRTGDRRHTAANAIRPAGKHYDYDVQSEVAALYGQIEQPFAERFKLTAGVRVEYVNYNYDNKMLAGNTRDDGTTCGPAGCLYARPADRSDDFSNVTSKLGLSYALTGNHVLYVTAARGMRAPDTSELYRLQRQQSIAELDSEELDSVELGARGAFGPLRYSLAGFKMKKDNVIFRDSAGFNVSNGKTDHEGVEYEFNWLPIETLTLALAGTYAKHTYAFNRASMAAKRSSPAATSTRRPATSTRRASTGSSCRLRMRSSSGSASAAISSTRRTPTNTRPRPAQPARGLDIRENWSTTLRLNNVTDAPTPIAPTSRSATTGISRARPHAVRRSQVSRTDYSCP
jgi:outer membrane receptor protein involved in Fe transport